MNTEKRRVTRLFVNRDLVGERVELDELEAHYLGHVLRLPRGAAVVAFNGRGSERYATVSSLQRRGATLALGAEHSVMPESPLKLTLVQALPKADAMDMIVQKATELGVHHIVPVYSEFSVVRLESERATRRLEHWQRIARGACEQCGRHAPPSIALPQPLATALEELPPASRRWALDPKGDRSFDQEPPPNADLIAAVGPEGGFGAEDWRHLAAASFSKITLGSRILRAETASIVLCAVAQARWGDL